MLFLHLPKIAVNLQTSNVQKEVDKSLHKSHKSDWNPINPVPIYKHPISWNGIYWVFFMPSSDIGLRATQNIQHLQRGLISWGLIHGLMW